MKKLLIVLLLILGVSTGLFFSGAGQRNILVPLANLYLSRAVSGYEVVLTELKPGPGSLRLAGTVDRTIAFAAEGPVKWSSLLFDLVYRIDGREVDLEGKRYPVGLALKGTLKGTPSRMSVTGEGAGFAATLEYRFLLVDSELRGITAEARGAKVDQLLALAGTRPYAGGRLNLRIDMPKLDTEHPEGTARFSILEGRIDSRALQRDFGIVLPKVDRYRLEGSFRLEKGLVRGGAKLRSPLANMDLKELRSDSGFRIFKSRFTLDIPELSNLRTLSKTTLYGPWKMEGELYHDRRKGILQVRGESPSLDGKSSFFYNNGRATLEFKNAGIPQLLAVTGQPPLAASGRFSGRARLEDLRKNPRGRYRIEAAGSWDRAELAKLAGTDPGEILEFTLQSSGELAKGVLRAEAEYRNPFFGLKFAPLRYALDGGGFQGEYLLKVPDLARLASLKKQGAKGPFSLKGTVSYLPIKKLLKVEGSSGSLGGETRFVYGGKRLNLTLKGVDGGRLMRLAGQPPILTGSRVDATVRFSDIGRKIGNFTLAARGILNRSVLRKNWELDPGPKVSVRLKGKGKFGGENLDAQWYLESSLGKLVMEGCRIRLDRGSCTGSYRLSIPELARLKPLTKRAYHGPLALAGGLSWDGKLHLTGAGNEWGGRIDYRLEGPLLRVRTTKLRAKELMKMLGYAPLIEGTASSDLRFNLETEKGTLKAELAQARFVKSTLTLVASRLLRYDLSKEVFDKVLFSSRIDGALVIFNFNARSKRLLLSVQRGKIDRKKGTIDATVSIDDRGKRYKLRLKGPLDRPRVTPIITDALVRKVEKELKRHKIDKKIEKALPKELRGEGNPVSSFIKKLF
jgi:hypothetical protein